MMKTSLILVSVLLFLSCSQKEHERKVEKDFCRGEIVGTEHNYFVIYLDYYKGEKCFVWSINDPYTVKRSGKEVRYKILPPFRRVMYKSLKMVWAPKVFPRSKPFYLEGRDSLRLPWNRYLNIFNDSIFWKESGFADLRSINKDDSLILEIPCVDENYVERNPVFQIGQTHVPVIECKIGVDKDY